MLRDVDLNLMHARIGSIVRSADVCLGLANRPLKNVFKAWAPMGS